MTTMLVVTILLAAAVWWLLWWPRKERPAVSTVMFVFRVDVAQYVAAMNRVIEAFSRIEIAASEANRQRLKAFRAAIPRGLEQGGAPTRPSPYFGGADV